MTDEALVVRTSFAQQSMWLENEINPGRPTYNVMAAVRLRGRLHLAALERALNMVVERHEALRTVFELDEDGPVQVIEPAPDLAVPVTETDPDAVEAAISAEVSVPFDLQWGPLVRLRLLRLAPEDHIAVLVMHHIVTDGVSSAIFFGELATCYEAYRLGREPGLPPLEIQYADFAVWQRETLRGDKLNRLTSYWTGQLAGAPPLRLITDRPRLPEPTYRGDTHAFALPPALGQKLEELARAERVTSFMVFLAAFDVLLARYSGQGDITVASPMAGRTRPELENLIGFFVNPLLLRIDLTDDPSARELIQRVRQACVGAYEHQELPFETALEILRTQRRAPAGTPQVEAMLVFQNMPVPDLLAGDLVFEPIRADTHSAGFDLVIDLEPAGEHGYRGFLEYSCDLFGLATAAKMATQFVEILADMAADPARQISRTPVRQDLAPSHSPLAAAAPASPPEQRAQDVPFRAPQTPLEKELHGIFSELLGVERIGVHDDFLALGGDSLSVIQLRSRVRAEYGVEFPIRELLPRIDIDRLAWLLLEKLMEEENAAVGPAPADAADGNLPPDHKERDSQP